MTRTWKLAAALAALTCGVAAPSALANVPLIVGGTAAPAGAWPSIAFLNGRYDDGGQSVGFHCTGSVVAPSWIVTAGHCAFGRPGQPPDGMTAVLGAADYEDQNAEVIPIDKFVPHPSYDRSNETDDIALLHLSTPTRQPPMRIATAAENSAGAYVSKPDVPNAAGWGATDEAGTQFTSLLQQAYLEIQSQTGCSALMPEFDPNTQTCAGTTGKAGVCFGDSGGPLITFDASTGAPVLWGVTSYRAGGGDGEAPCSLTQPAVFSWVPAFTDFIQSTLAGGAPPPGGGGGTDIVNPTPGPATGPGAAGVPRPQSGSCRRATAHLTASRRAERVMKRNLSKVRGLATSAAVRRRVTRADSRYRRAHARTVRATTRTKSACRPAH